MLGPVLVLALVGAAAAQSECGGIAYRGGGTVGTNLTTFCGSVGCSMIQYPMSDAEVECVRNNMMGEFQLSWGTRDPATGTCYLLQGSGGAAGLVTKPCSEYYTTFCDCSLRYTCAKDQCVPAKGSGGMSMAECNSMCGPGPGAINFRCLYGMCLPAAKGVNMTTCKSNCN